MCKQLDLAPGGPEDGDGVPAFLAKAMSPPHAKAVSNALELLVELGAMLPETNDLTTLGECLATISLHPRVGKMVIWSYILGCARAACNMAVAMSYKSPFTLPPTSMRKAADDAKVRMSQNSESDQVTVHFALEKQEQYKNQTAFGDFCRRNFLGVSTMQMISDLRKNLTRELESLGFSNPSTRQGYHNRHDSDHSLWQASITAGLYPNMALRRRGDVNFSTMTNQKVKVHVSSVNAVRGQPLSAKCQVPKGEIEFMCFGEIVKGARMFTANQTMHLASPLPLLLLCGTSLSVRPADAQKGDPMAVLNMDDWIVFKTDVNTAAHIVVLRKRLESAFWNVVSNPSAGLSNLTDIERDAVEILGTVVRSAHMSAPSR
jgi:HrpA-like RNA helicase